MLKKSTPIIFLVIQLIAEALLIFAMIKSAMVPMVFVIAAIAIAAILMVISVALAFVNIEGKKNSVIIFRRIIAAFLALLMAVVSAFSWLAFNKVDETITGITTKKPTTTAIGVYVLASDPAKTIEDAAHYDFGYATNFEVENSLSAIEDIEDQVDGKIKTETYEDTMEMVQDLYDGKIDAIIMSESYASLVEDQEAFIDFADDTKIIYEYAIVTDNNDNDSQKDHDLSAFVVYLSGSDTRSRMLSVSRSDVNILMAVNTETKEILLINTPRDYYVPISKSSSGARDKLTHCGIYGVKCSMDTLSAFYGHDIDYYAQINFTGFETLINAVGGVTVYADTAFSDGKVSVTKGENFLNGSEALAFARDRHHQPGGDRGRGNNQMKLITAVIDKMSAGTILTNYSDILKSLQGMFITDMSSNDINTLIKMQLSDMSKWSIHSYAVTGSDGSSTTYSMPGTHAYVMYPNQQMVSHASDLMGRVLAGEHITDADVK